MNLKKLIKIDKKIDLIISKSIDEDVLEFEEHSSYPNTISSFVRLITSSDQIKDSILHLSEQGEIYSIHILYRSLIEQLLKTQYIFFRFNEEKDDVCGTEFIEIYDLYDKILVGRSWHKISELKDGRKYKKDYMMDVFKEVNEDFIKYPQEKIESVAKQFRFNDLLLWFYNNTDKMNKESYDEILFLIPEYAELSSIVHGHPSAFNHLPRCENENQLDNICFHFAYKSLKATNIIKGFSFIAFTKMDKRFEHVLIKITELNKTLKQIVLKERRIK